MGGSIQNTIQSQLLEKMATEPIKREGRYVNGKFKTWKECIKTILMVKMLHII